MRALNAAACCCVLCLCACGEQPPDARGSDAKVTPALVALAERGDLPALDALLSVGEPPDAFDSCRWTPLMKAAQNGHLATARRLLQAGADPDARDKGGYTALMFAASRGHRELTALLLERGADPDHREDAMGWTALIWAAKEGRADTVRVLLGHGADAMLPDRDGRSAADWAEENGHRDVLALLRPGPPAPRTAPGDIQNPLTFPSRIPALRFHGKDGDGERRGAEAAGAGIAPPPAALISTLWHRKQVSSP